MQQFDFQSALAIRQREERQAGHTMLVAAVVLWVILLGAIWGAAFALAALFSAEDGLPRWWWPWAAAGAAALVLGVAVPFFLRDESQSIDAPEEFDFSDQLLRRHDVVAGQLAFAFMLFPSKVTAEALRHLHHGRGLDMRHHATAERITAELCRANDWLPAARYADSGPALLALIRLDILRTKPVHGQPYVRLNPSLMP